jgi:Zn-dependent M28 family amino/carboxypeptidase
MELDRAKQSKPILGANDGASGTAILLELARQFQAAKPKVGVVMAFFDCEDYGTTPLTMFIGAKKFAEDWKNEVRPGGREPKYDYGILLDMVGDKDLEIRRDAWSMMKNPKIVDKVWAAARNSGHSDAFLEDGSYSVDDDHIPISVAGIKCIDVIDFNYASWHTLDDTPDKCSPKSLKTVGDVISKVIYDENPGK